MDAAQLRPLSIGEILDVAIKIYRERFSHLVKAVVAVVGPVSLLGALVQVSVGPEQSDLFTTSDPTAVEPTFDVGDFWAFLAGILVVAFLSFIAAEVATAASFKLVSGAYLDTEPDWRESLRFAVSKVRSLLWLAFLTGILVGLGLLACLIPGIYFYGAWSVAIPILLLEDLRGRAALKRSRALVQGRWWPTVAAVLVAAILAAIVQSVFSGLVVAASIGDVNDFVDALVRAVASTIGGMLTTPFTAAVITVVYFDLRVRKEGFDLELLARRVGVEPPSGSHTDSAPARDEAPSAQPPYWPPPPGWRPPDA